MNRKLALPLSALFCISTAAFAQTTGVSTPPEAVIEERPLPATAAAPVAAQPTPMEQHHTPISSETYGPYVPYKAAGTATIAPVQKDDDSGIVNVIETSGELRAGSLLRVRIEQEFGTDQTAVGTLLSGEVTENVSSAGRVIIPAGSRIFANVTEVQGGRRIHGAAMVHVQPHELVLPNGTHIQLHASVIDTDKYADVKVDNEGNLVRRDHVGATAAAMSLTTGSAAAAGGVIGGIPGALIGAGIGAGVSTVWWLKQDRQMHLPKDTVLVLSLGTPLTVEQTQASTAQ